MTRRYLDIAAALPGGDYAAFADRCLAADLGPCSFDDFSQLVHLLAVAAAVHPDRDPVTVALELLGGREIEPVEDPNQMPGLWEMAGNALLAAGQVVASGFKLVPGDVQVERERICRACDRVEPDAFRCSQCGCFMAAKTRLAAMACPLGRW